MINSDDEELRAPAPPSWSTNDKGNPTAPRFINRNETSLCITGAKESRNPIVSETRTNFIVSILPKMYPLSKLTEIQMKLIKKCILKKIIEQSNEVNVKPQFNSFHCNAGYTTLNCNNNVTASWTKSIIRTLKPWEGASFITVDEEPPSNLTTFFRFIFPNPELIETDQIINMITAQNFSLNINNWYFLKRVRLIEDNFMLLFAIDQQSADKLSKINRKISFGLLQLDATIIPLEEVTLEEFNSTEGVPHHKKTRGGRLIKLKTELAQLRRQLSLTTEIGQQEALLIRIEANQLQLQQRKRKAPAEKPNNFNEKKKIWGFEMFYKT